MKIHENICVFYKKLPTYNPQFTEGKPYKIKAAKKKTNSRFLGTGSSAADMRNEINNDGKRYPLTIIEKKRDKNKLHPTQKPVELCEWLIKTYTSEGQVVLDSCMGSGSTIVASINTNRKYIGFELDVDIFNLAKNRIENFLLEKETLQND